MQGNKIGIRICMATLAFTCWSGFISLNHSSIRGINFNLPDAIGFTVLHELCKTGKHLLITEVLLRLSMNYCIDVNALNNERKTAFPGRNSESVWNAVVVHSSDDTNTSWYRRKDRLIVPE